MSAFRTTGVRRDAPGTIDPWHLARTHAHDLADAARGVLDEVGAARLCGLVVAPGAELGVPLRALLWQCRGQHDERATCVGVVEFSALARALRSEARAAALLAHARAALPGTLPVLVASTCGLRLASIATGRVAHANG